MSDLPEPLTPADSDLRGLPYMPLDVARLMESDLFALSTGDQFKAAVALWSKAWFQVPAGSLPDDDRILAHLSSAGPNWSNVRAMALHGWFRCSDGRLYHKVIGPKACEAWKARLAQRARANKRWSGEAAASNVPPVAMPADSHGNAVAYAAAHATAYPVAHPVAYAVACVDALDDATAYPAAYAVGDAVAHAVAMQVEVQVKEEEGRKDIELSLSSSQLASPGFEEFWRAYPRKIAKDGARKAFAKAVRSTSPAAIMAGLQRAQWNPDPKYVPHAATWLNAGRWQDEVAEVAPSRPAPLQPSQMPCMNDEPSAWAGVCDRFEEDDRDGVMRPMVGGDYLDIAARRIGTMAGFSWDWHGDWNVLAGWLRDGLNFERHIRPTIYRITERPDYQTPRSLKFFDQAVRSQA